MYTCKYFEIQELVDPQVFATRGEQAWQLLDESLLITLDRLRSRYGQITINNWHAGGNRSQSGLRLPGSLYYSQYSQHSYGRAADCLFKDVTVAEVRADILATPDDYEFELITALEKNVSWLHIDIRNVKRIFTFSA